MAETEDCSAVRENGRRHPRHVHAVAATPQVEKTTELSADSSVHVRIAEVARELHHLGDLDINEVLQTLVVSAAQYVPGAQHTSITMTDGRRGLDSPASTSLHSRILDELQKRYRQGPCVESAWEHRTMRVPDLASDRRWPALRRAVLAESPIRSILAFELFTNDQTMGALNLYAEYANAFSSESEEVGLVFATHGALAWHAARRDDQFRSALASRDVIGQAKGMLMERFSIDAVAAFNLLMQLSQESNIRVSEISRHIVDSHEAPADPPKL